MNKKNIGKSQRQMKTKDTKRQNSRKEEENEFETKKAFYIFLFYYFGRSSKVIAGNERPTIIWACILY